MPILEHFIENDAKYKSYNIVPSKNVELLEKNVHLINHVHISEPGLKPIQKRRLHNELVEMLKVGGYQRFISIEVGRVG